MTQRDAGPPPPRRGDGRAAPLPACDKSDSRVLIWLASGLVSQHCSRCRSTPMPSLVPCGPPSPSTFAQRKEVHHCRASMPKGETRFLHTLTVVVLHRRLSGCAGLHSATAGRVFTVSFCATSRRFYTGDTSKPPSASSVASSDTFTEACGQSTPTGIQSVSRCHPTEQPRAATSDLAADAAGASSSPLSTPPSSTSSAFTASPVVPPTDSNASDLTTPDPEPVRWVQPTYQDSDTLPIVDEKGEYIVSRVQWPTGEVAYRTPPPVDGKLAPRFGYNVVQVRKHVSWWKYNQKYPRLSLAYINIQVLFLLGLAWLVAFLTSEYRHTIEAMRTPGAMVGEHRGKGPATNRTQKISFEKEEMNALLDKAQSNWYDGKAEASYVGSKAYKMKKIPRPTEFSADDFRKR
ncbi:hypothetical protein, conserved [Leishmania tarentolae]|uniref:Uncharacterized protein n=1 Tax=Leishmania tarentolae TaxID=5689 RepID=A0A640KDB2_LEITA|nr:hypothetical protein, conserved [Leishmania tarentolae]